MPELPVQTLQSPDERAVYMKRLRGCWQTTIVSVYLADFGAA